MVWQTGNSGREMFQPDAASLLAVLAGSSLFSRPFSRYECASISKSVFRHLKYKQQSMLPLQCKTAEEEDRCLFYAYPEQHIHHQLMLFHDHVVSVSSHHTQQVSAHQCSAHVSAAICSSPHRS